MNKIFVAAVLATVTTTASAMDKILLKREAICSSPADIHQLLTNEYGEKVVVTGTSGTVFAGEKAEMRMYGGKTSYTFVLVSKTHACIFETGEIYRVL